MNEQEKLQALLTASNNTTGETDTTLTDAVQRLVDGYGGGGGLVDATYVDYTVATQITKWHQVWDLCAPNIAAKRDAGGLSIKDDVYIIECPNNYATTESYVFDGPWFGYATSNSIFKTHSLAYRRDRGIYEGGELNYQSAPANRDCQIPAGVILRCWHIPRRY